jgi:serine/threonine protein kinase
MCGTLGYMAPEVVNQVNQEGYDQLVDSWSVGVIVLEMSVYSLTRSIRLFFLSPGRYLIFANGKVGRRETVHKNCVQKRG